MQKETLIVKEVLPQESFSRPGQAPTLKQSVVFQFPTREGKLLLVTFYGDKVREAMILNPGDEVEVGYVISSSCSSKGFWGTYVTGIFMQMISRRDDAPMEALQHQKLLDEGEQQVTNSLSDLGINIPTCEPDDLPF